MGGLGGPHPCAVTQRAVGEPLRVTFPVSKMTEEIRETRARAILNSARPEAALRHYFQTDTPYAPIFATFPPGTGIRTWRAPWRTVAHAHSAAAGVGDDSHFICSAQKQIVQIMQMNKALRERYAAGADQTRRADPHNPLMGQRHAGSPSPRRAAGRGERRRSAFASSGFALGTCTVRAADRHRHPIVPTRAEMARSPSRTPSSAYSIPRRGEKVASCILLFAYARMDDSRRRPGPSHPHCGALPPRTVRQNPATSALRPAHSAKRGAAAVPSTGTHGAPHRSFPRLRAAPHPVPVTAAL